MFVVLEQEAVAGARIIVRSYVRFEPSSISRLSKTRAIRKIRMTVAEKIALQL
jgi:hypothetical protein